MFAVVFVLLSAWAVAGVVASTRAAFATQADMASDAVGNGLSSAAGVTFGGHQRAAYDRWRARLRHGMRGTPGGPRIRDMAADAGAATLAAAGLFAAGFATGMAWFATGKTAHAATNKARRTPGTRQQRADRPKGASEPKPPRPSRPDHGSPDVIDGELLDDPPATPGPTGRGPVVDAEVIDDPNPYPYPDVPALDSGRTDDTAPEGPDMPEILNIHQLINWAKTVGDAAAQLAEEAAIRSRAATGRAEAAVTVADTAAGQASQLDAVQARFASLEMDPASLAAIAVAMDAAAKLAADEQRRAEAEHLAAQSAVASANSAQAYQAAIAAMAATVQARQGPHAMAQAETGNAAAHASVLAVS